jgi:hypothetical protein
VRDEDVESGNERDEQAGAKGYIPNWIVHEASSRTGDCGERCFAGLGERGSGPLPRLNCTRRAGA